MSGNLRAKSMILCLSLPKHSAALTHAPHTILPRRMLSVRRGSGGIWAGEQNTNALQPASYKPKRPKGDEKFLIANALPGPDSKIACEVLARGSSQTNKIFIFKKDLQFS